MYMCVCVWANVEMNDWKKKFFVSFDRLAIGAWCIYILAIINNNNTERVSKQQQNKINNIFCFWTHFHLLFCIPKLHLFQKKNSSVDCGQRVCVVVVDKSVVIYYLFSLFLFFLCFSFLSSCFSACTQYFRFNRNEFSTLDFCMKFFCSEFGFNFSFYDVFLIPFLFSLFQS